MKKYAHNRHNYNDCNCPAVEAGFTEIEDPIEVTVAQREMFRKYDFIAGMNEDGRYGLVSEEDAKKYWQLAIERVDTEEAAEFGRKVQKELGWDE
jgi:hypothetical protein